MTRSPRILIAGGGTGGHVYPAIAIADALRDLEPEASIAFAGTTDRLEWRAVPAAGYAIHPITIQGFHRGQWKRNISFPFKLAKGLWQSWDLIGAFDPDVVVGTGGFVAGPVGYAARLRKRPLVIQEQNAFPGVTNKLLGKYAHTVHLAFEAAKKYFKAERCELSGNPTRKDLQQLSREEGLEFYDLPQDAQVLFMFGGSLGSSALNRAMEKSWEKLLEDSSLYIVWQTGPAYYEALRERVQDHPRLRLLGYIERMDLAYAVADVALARSGAISCSELLVTGTPAILVPSPNVAEDHQTQNAKSMKEAGAALMLPEAELEDKLFDIVTNLLNDTARLERMSQAAAELAKPDAAEKIARSVLGVIS